MTSLEHLLPAPDQSVRCVDHSRGLAVDPGGTAIRADRVILVETPLPWPKPVFGHPVLQEINAILQGSIRPIRTLAYVPPSPGPPPSAVGPEGAAADSFVPTVITLDRPTGSGDGRGPIDAVIERRFNPSTTDELLDLGRALATDETQAIDAMAQSIEAVTGPILLVCTQGSHDVCCGSEGARFAAEAEALDGLTVYRVSHTGGHRFAPTAMTLPDGRMWSDLDLDLLRQILARTGQPADVADRCRGWWGADPGPAQMAERAVFEAAGWELEDVDRSIELDQSSDRSLDGTVRCVVDAGDRSWEVLVAPSRTVPTIACRQPGGLPAKQSVEYEIKRITEI
ncbi:MAG: sucrase ferredoxin [Acidimicrobiales bacterium]